MATEQGIVIKTIKNKAWIKTTRSGACKNCASRSSCNSANQGTEMEVEAYNEAGAKPGERVVFKIKSTPLLKASFLLYVFPILCMIAGAFIGQTIAPAFNSNPSAFAGIFGFLFFFLSFFIIRSKGAALAQQKEYKPKIIRIIKA